jgi:hypothetical protein
MREFAQIASILILLLSNFGCGKDNPGNKAAYQENSSNCSFEFVDNYNSIITTIRLVSNVQDLDRAESLVNEFASKYKGVVCRATLTNPDHLDSTPSTINADQKVQEWKSLITGARPSTSS